jgi:hypothetical protein
MRESETEERERQGFDGAVNGRENREGGRWVLNVRVNEERERGWGSSVASWNSQTCGISC